MGGWCDGVMECWEGGVMGRWYDGVMECWEGGVME